MHRFILTLVVTFGSYNMEFEWDENKRLHNIEKHGIDFLDAATFFEHPIMVSVSTVATDEKRFIAVGLLYERYITTVFVKRGDKTRIISMRKARTDERRKYNQLYSETTGGNAA